MESQNEGNWLISKAEDTKSQSLVHWSPLQIRTFKLFSDLAPDFAGTF